MRSVTVRASAKINLALAVGRRRADGYHPLATVYQAVDLCDEVRASDAADPGIELAITYDSPPGAEPARLPLDETNIAHAAARALLAHARLERGVSLTIRKAIPVSGGMAGGSADAAAVLVACDALWDLGTPRAELAKLAAELGSDVPFCLLGGTAMGTGRGELVSPVLARGSYHWVLALAAGGLPTPSVYAAFDRLDGAPPAGETPQVAPAVLAALRSGDPAALGLALHNDLQEATLALRPDLAGTMALGEECGALGSLVSGSGPTVMFLAADGEHALDLALALSGANVCADVVQAVGPVPGVRVIG
ncbi:MAG: 4-(cytidine 5'-diphospho)-2-C-methyl-D-erythritol kinase [Nocardioidaceae bacterium]